eukprot:XP_014037528.1 PREDICTED: uncharacterized protein LOC106590878 [Salmo salar]
MELVHLGSDQQAPVQLLSPWLLSHRPTGSCTASIPLAALPQTNRLLYSFYPPGCSPTDQQAPVLLLSPWLLSHRPTGSCTASIPLAALPQINRLLHCFYPPGCSPTDQQAPALLLSPWLLSHRPTGSCTASIPLAALPLPQTNRLLHCFYPPGCSPTDQQAPALLLSPWLLSLSHRPTGSCTASIPLAALPQTNRLLHCFYPPGCSPSPTDYTHCLPDSALSTNLYPVRYTPPLSLT